MLFFTLAALSSGVWASNEILEDFFPFFEIKEKILGTVCDESVVLKAPSLEALRETAPAIGLNSGILQGGEERFSVQVHLPEWRVLGFLLGDPFSIVASDYVKTQMNPLWGTQQSKEPLPVQAEQHSQMKRKISLELCTALLTPGKLRSLLQAKPSWLLAASRGFITKPSAFTSTQQFVFQVFDFEERFGKTGSHWWIPGWVELSEVDLVWSAKRIYRRLSNPLTNRTQFIVVMNEAQELLGFFYISPEGAISSFDSLKKQALSDPVFQKQQEIYRLMIEVDAHRMLSVFPEQSNKIKELQEVYKNKIQSAKGKNLIQKSEWIHLEKSLDAQFFQALSLSRVNGNRVAFRLFIPAVSLNLFYKNYHRELSLLKKSPD